jgi:hypothetical protein
VSLTSKVTVYESALAKLVVWTFMVPGFVADETSTNVRVSRSEYSSGPQSRGTAVNTVLESVPSAKS